jgi:hypothetical protein
LFEPSRLSDLSGWELVRRRPEKQSKFYPSSSPGSEKANWRIPNTCLVRVFHFKLGRFAFMKE